MFANETDSMASGSRRGRRGIGDGKVQITNDAQMVRGRGGT